MAQGWLVAGCLAMLCGCSDSRSWGACSLIGATLLGGVAAAGVIVGTRDSAPNVSAYPFPAQQRESNRLSDIAIYGGIPAAIGGIVIGGLAGHYLCDPEKEPVAGANAPANTASAQPLTPGASPGAGAR